MNAWFRYSLWALLNLRKNSWSLLILSFRVMTTTRYWRGIKLNIRSALWYLRDAEMQIWSRSVAQLWGGGELDSPLNIFLCSSFPEEFLTIFSFSTWRKSVILDLSSHKKNLCICYFIGYHNTYIGPLQIIRDCRKTRKSIWIMHRRVPMFLQ